MQYNGSFQIKMIEDSGYSAELHTVITEDDYVLGVHRIPMREPTTKVALLVHGIHCTAAEFIVTGRSSSLGGIYKCLGLTSQGMQLTKKLFCFLLIFNL